MRTKTLLKISLIVLFVSLFILIAVSNSLEPRAINISSINKKILDEWVKLKGQVEQVKNIKTETGEITIFKIADETGSIDCVFYENLDLNKGLKVEIIGKITEYKGDLQIQVKSIKI